MQDILNELLKETSYLDPYLRQFLKYLKGNKVLLLGNNSGNIDKKLQNMGYLVEKEEVFNNDSCGQYDGIILFNTLNEVDKSSIPQLFENIYNKMNDNAYIFIIIRIGKNTSNYSLEYLDVIMESKYLFVEELPNYDNLKFYIYEKNTIKWVFFLL